MAKNEATPAPISPTSTLTKGNVLAALAESIHDVGQELSAWRHFGSDVVEFLKQKKLSDAFEKFRAKRAAKR